MDKTHVLTRAHRIKIKFISPKLTPMIASFLKRVFTVLSFFMLGTLSTSAQNDIILKTNGEEMVGKVIAVDSDSIIFTYKDETVEYTVPNPEISKITFSSGRIQFFNNSTETKSSATSLGDHYNKVAILPFVYIKNQETGSGGMTEKIQRETFNVFQSKAISLKYQDINTTNNLLAKAGVTNDNTSHFTMGEICNILGVEYLIQGIVSVEKTGSSNYSSTSVSGKSKEKTGKDKIGNLWGVAKGSASASTYGSTTDNYESSININIYNNHGENLFSQDHNSFWQTEDAYKVTLNYLAKKSPFYKK